MSNDVRMAETEAELSSLDQEIARGQSLAATPKDLGWTEAELRLLAREYLGQETFTYHLGIKVLDAVVIDELLRHDYTIVDAPAHGESLLNWLAGREEVRLEGKGT